MWTAKERQMGHTLTLDVPEDVYQSLQRQAEQTGQSPEIVAVQLLATATQPHGEDPLLSPLRIPRPRLTAFIEGLKVSPYVDIVHVDPTLDAQAWQLFTERPDKEWSLVDCASFVVMRQRGILEAFTTDHH
jgi:hypothetical protein